MTKIESGTLSCGIYRLYWKSGGTSIAAVGITEHGTRWMAPINWVEPSTRQHAWRMVSRVQRITGDS